MEGVTPHRHRAPAIAAAALGVLLVVLATAAPASAASARPTQEEPTESVRGTLRNDRREDGERIREPVEGVDITVASEGGEEIETVTTDDQGQWEVALPGPGRYVATIDIGSLPDEVELRNEEREAQAFPVGPGQRRTVLFPLGEDPREVGSKLDELYQLLFEGAKLGLIIAMTAVGLSLIFGTTGLVNFAHGELVTGGALIAFVFNRIVGIQLIPATLLAMVVTAAAGGLVEGGIWRPLRRRRTGLIAMLVISIGLSLLFRYLFLFLFEGRTRPFGDYNLQSAVSFGPVDVSPKDLWSIAISLVAVLGVALLLQLTRLGKAMRAVSDNAELASASGIDVDRIILLVWVAGGGLACLGGVLLGLAEQVSWEMGFRLLLLMFAGVTLGGLGTAYGALLGSFIIGVITETSTLWIDPSLKAVPALFALALILLVRPQGILGRAERIG